MTLKTYQAATMSEALAAVKRDLGRDAVILHTRSFRKGGLLGLIGGRAVWEITASPNANVPRRGARGEAAGEATAVAERPAAAERPGAGERPGAAERSATKSPADGKTAGGKSAEGKFAGGKSPSLRPPAAHAAPGAPPVQDHLRREMGELRKLVEAMVIHRGGPQSDELPAELQKLHAHLLQQDVEPAIADELTNHMRMTLTGGQLADGELVRQCLLDLVAQRIRVVPPAAEPADGTSRIIAMIGPTGVGKTTTIAKLAANFKLREGKRVGLITIDTYRIAAVDQLKTYADIIDVPLRAVLTAEELRQAVQAMGSMDVILIDTAGRSQNDKLRLSQLRRFLEASGANEVHLVVSAAASRTCMRSTIGQFAPLGVNRVLLTKLDEAETFGSVLNVCATGTAALGYITTGQEVPDDIAVADPRRLAGWIAQGAFDGN